MKKEKFIIIFLLLVVYCCCDERQPIIKKYNVGDSRVFVLDGFVEERIGRIFSGYINNNLGYTYMYPDPYEGHLSDSEGNLFWKAPLSPNVLIKMRMWKFIRDAYKALPEEIHKGKRFLPYDACGFFLTRADTPISFKPQSIKSDEIFVRIFLANNYNKNIYGDQAFYSDDDEIAFSVYPKNYRIVMWTGPVETLFRPPGMGYENSLYGVFLKLTNDVDVYQQAAKAYEAEQTVREQQAKLPFPFTNQVNKFDLDSLNPADHLLGKYYDRKGNVVAFFDNVVPKEMLNAIRSYYVQHGGSLLPNSYDPSSSESNDNVKFIYQFKPERVLNTPYHVVVTKLAEYLSNHTGWHPYDVSCNLIQHTHHTRIHIDCTDEEFEYTFLLYLNPNWNADKYAETSFYDYANEESEEKNVRYNWATHQHGNQSFEFVAAAVPKFGRIAIFRNLIPHSARPPASNFLAARYTFPIKVSESRAQARAKMLREALEMKTDDMEEDSLYQRLRDGYYEEYFDEKNQEWVSKHLQLMRDTQQQSKQEMKESFERNLIPGKFRNSQK